MSDRCHPEYHGSEVKVLCHRRRLIVFGGDFRSGVHRPESFRRYPCPAIEALGEIAGRQQEWQPDDVDDVIGYHGKPQLCLGCFEHFLGGKHVAGAADPAPGQRSETLPGVVREPPMHDHVGNDAADHDAGGTH